MIRQFVWLSLAAILIAVISFAATSYNRNDAVKILFIGNSLTSANNLPAMVADIANSQDDHLIFDAYTPGGARLFHHASDKNIMRKLRDQSWDFVVLQEQSQYPGFGAKQLATDVFPYATQLAAQVRKANPQTHAVFYMAMANRKGDPANEHVSAQLLTYEGAQARVSRSYSKMARDNRGLIAPVGEAWRTTRQQRPQIELYGDNTHPNPSGTYLAACVFYATLFQRPCTGAAVPRGLDQADAEYLQRVADEVVLKSGNQWDWRE